ncbi:putative beta-barrel assembly-enhancing protease [Thiosulfatimonas sediminis]|uniref:Putative beta-barrel assembly-enhancing protease n=2 Tax=Thiosulfatimonas sediminis TaxID=2675054 RepID=A0A6F8PWJ6_9GAMM|nr:putative beta-barrel assembly-enhancing protease [Thiosulfatimonas sediminis]
MPLSATQAINNLPDLGAPDLVEYDRATEQQLGRAFTQALHTQFDLINDPETLNYIRQMSYQIASHSGQQREFSFYVINNDSINAFAGPNGVIGIHTGLIAKVETADELASVIAHEIAHVTQQHLSRTYEYNSTQGTLNSFATLIAAILVGMANPNAGVATLMGGMGLNMEDQLKNSREHEKEADNVGIQILYESGYDPHAMGAFFGKLAKESQFNALQVPEILRTHPVTLNRLAAAESRAQVMPPFIIRNTPNDLTLIKLRIAALNKQLNQVARKTLSADERCYLDNLQELGNTFHQTQLNSSAEKLKCLVNAAEKNMMQPLYSTLLVERLMQFSSRNAKNTLNEYVKTIKQLIEYQQDIWPGNLAVRIRHAELLNTLHQPEQAMQVLQQGLQQESNQFTLNNYLAQFADNAGKQALANYYQAQAQLAIGNYSRALHFIEQAERLNEQNKEGIAQQINYFKAQNQDKIRKPSKNN